MRRWLFAALLSTHGMAFAEAMNEHAMDPWFARTDVELHRNADSNDWSLEYRYMGGPDFHKLLVEIEAESKAHNLHESSTGIFYGRPIGTWGLFKAGASYRQRPAHAWRTAIGYEHLLPGFVEAEITVYGYAGEIETELSLERPTALSNRITAYPGIEARYASYHSDDQEIGKGWNFVEPYFRLEWKWSAAWHVYSEYRFKKALGEHREQKRASGDDTDEHQWNIGLRMMF